MNLIDVYLAICDGGDGSAHICFFKDKAKVDWLLENDESFYQNEGSATCIQVPSDTVLNYSDDNHWLFEEYHDA